MKRILIIGCDKAPDIDKSLREIGFTVRTGSCGEDLDENDLRFDAAVAGRCASCYVKKLGIKVFDTSQYIHLSDLIEDIVKWDSDEG